MKRLKNVLIGVLIVFMMTQIMLHIANDSLQYHEGSKDYYIMYGLEETSSKNLVTAIYLDYRLFDSFFEASLLLIAVTGIAFMAIKDEDLL